MTAPAFDVVVPTIGRPSLAALLRALAAGAGPLPERLFVVDDRPAPAPPLALPALGALEPRVRVLASGGRGPAAARNAGWRAGRAPWIAFLDDDVVPGPDWRHALAEDLTGLAADLAASQGRIEVPAPVRRPTDAERRTLALASARCITADLACRREALAALGGFDERFRRAYREDTDLELRLRASGRRIARGRRRTAHPIPPSRWLASVADQAGNADDVLLAALHGRGWRRRLGEPPGRFPRHAAIVAAGLLAALALAGGRRRLAAAAGAAWLAGTAELAGHRIRRGPGTAREVAAMLATSVLIPPAAIHHRLRGHLRVAALCARGALRRAPRPAFAPDERCPERTPLRLVLLDRDGTLIHDEPERRDPSALRPMPTAARALARLRARGVRIAIVTNQPALAAGRLAPAALAALHGALERRLGPFAGVFVCPHAPDAGCACRKPAPGLLAAALRELGVAADECALIGDIGSDVEAASALGIRSVLVPTPITRREEIAAAPCVAPDLDAAVRLLLAEGS